MGLFDKPKRKESTFGIKAGLAKAKIRKKEEEKFFKKKARKELKMEFEKEEKEQRPFLQKARDVATSKTTKKVVKSARREIATIGSGVRKFASRYDKSRFL